MISIIEEIIENGKGKSEYIKMSKEYFDILDNVTEVYKDLIKTLSQKQLINFNRYCELKDMLDCELTAKTYEQGFKIGLLLGIECTKI